jgi:predicted PurR-regulated permease PerM
MYKYLIFLFFSCLLIFIIYKFYPKINNFIKQFLPKQSVLDIKATMKKVDKENQQDIPKIKTNYEIFLERINEITYMPIVFIQKATSTLLNSWNIK